MVVIFIENILLIFIYTHNNALFRFAVIILNASIHINTFYGLFWCELHQMREKKNDRKTRKEWSHRPRLTCRFSNGVIGIFKKFFIILISIESSLVPYNIHWVFSFFLPSHTNTHTATQNEHHSIVFVKFTFLNIRIFSFLFSISFWFGIFLYWFSPYTSHKLHHIEALFWQTFFSLWKWQLQWFDTVFYFIESTYNNR